MKIDQISKENIKHYNLDYILIDDFAIDWATEENIVKTELWSAYHPVHEYIENNKADIISAVNTAFDVDTTNLIHGLQVFDKEDEIIPHDDYTGELLMPNGEVPYTEMPIRAILYLNPEYMYGTHIHKEEPGWADEDDSRWWVHMWDKGIELGGQPGQLLIIKPNSNSWHSVGCFNTTLDNRITGNWIFKN